MQKTPIEYLTHTWNPIAMRCTRVSNGCANCWHLRMAHRMASNPSICQRRRDAYAGGEPWLDPHELSSPLRRKKPVDIGVQFMGDIFHESITSEQIAAAFGVMAATPHHQYYILTKRERMVEWFGWIAQCGRMVPFQVGEEIPKGASGEAAACAMSNTTDPELTPIEPKAFITGVHQPWPLPNVTMGVSVEDQPTADERISWLLKTMAAKRFVSVEPLLGPVELFNFLDDIDWVVTGSEAGPGARPCNEDWIRSVRDQCIAANVPFFFKQIIRNGKRISMPKLDGRIWNDFVKQ